MAGIDGNLLLKMREEDLIGPPINMALSLHRRVLMQSLAMIYSQKKLTSEDFWSYKATNRAKSLFLLFGLRLFPRTTMAYHFIFDYQNVFLPVLHRTCEPDILQEPPTVDHAIPMGNPTTWQQWRYFMLLLLFVPYYIIGVFACDYLQINYWISRIIILHCIAMTGCELTQIGWLVSKRGYRTLPGLMVKNVGLALVCRLAQKILWPFIPHFISDMIFSWMFFISPFDAWNRLFKRINNLRNHQEDIPVEGADRNARFQFDFQFRRG